MLSQTVSDTLSSQSQASYIFASAGGPNGQAGNELWIAGAGLSEPRLLKEINPGLASSDPRDFTALPNGKVVFVANDGLHGRELWVTDGTEAGTQMVRDIGQGDGSISPKNFTLVGDKVLFTVADGVHGNELWVTDGSTEGTRLLKDINPGAAGSAISGMTELSPGKFLFTATTSESGTEFWVTDGTAEGTLLLVEMKEGAESGASHVTRVFEDGTAELTGPGGTWMTDGTTDGTVQLTDRPVANEMVALGGDKWLYTAFANSLEYEYSLFVTGKDGDQTLIAPDQHTIGGRYSGEVKLTALGAGKAIIQSAEDLFVTDGTPDGTQIIHTGLTIHAMTDFVSLGDGRALFMNRDGSPGDVTAADLWVTDGTEAGTYQIAPMSRENPTSLPDHVQDLGDGRFAFAAPTEGHAGAVWVTDLSAGSLERNPTINSWSGYSVFMPIVVAEPPVEPPVEPPAENQAPTGDPDVVGNARVGELLTANLGDLADADGIPGEVSFQWMRAGEDGQWQAIDGATATTYTLTEADLGHSFKVVASYVDGLGKAEQVSSLATEVVAAPPGTPDVEPPAPIGEPEWSETLPLFDIAHYLENNQDVAASGMDPLEHFLQYGGLEGRSPNAGFDTAYYLEQNPDVAAAGINPFLHYLAHGAEEGRAPNAGDAPAVSNPAVTMSELAAIARDLLASNTTPPAQEPPAPVEPPQLAGLLDIDFYLSTYEDVQMAGADALTHYMTFGWHEGRDPNALFDTSFYLERNTDVADAGVNPMEHYLLFGGQEDRDPSLAFDGSAYLDTYADVASAGVNPLLHYLQFGMSEGRDIFAV